MNIAYAPRRQVNHKYINRSIEQWLDIHFGDTSFNGRAFIGHRKPGGGIYTMSARSLTELRPYVKLIHASTRLDYYITANTVSGTRRLKNELFGLQNIVIDVDCHDAEQAHSVSALVQAFIWRSKRDLWDTGIIPTPNSIVRTGRGVQLWWALVPCYGGHDYGVSRYHYDKIKNNMMDHIEVLLDENSEELTGLGVDRGASSNPVGYFRLPYTYNTTAKCYTSLEILHSERYDQRDLTRMERPEITTSSEVARLKEKYIPLQESDRTILRNCQTAGALRVLQLIKLRNLRDNEVGSEMRDYFNFSVYNALRMSYEHEQAMTRLRAFNAGFKEPMTKDELLNCVVSAKEKGGYKYTNEKLVEMLVITPEEQAAIGLFPASRKRRVKPNASRDEARRALREDRDYQILTLVEKGVPQAETARILGISKNTVGSVVKKYRVEKSEKDEDSTRPNFGSIYVLNNSSAPQPYGSTTTRMVKLTDGALFVMPKHDSS